jgi:hypothetical protein
MDCLIGDNAALARSADGDRLATQLRIVALLHRGEKRIHVDMEDFALPHGTGQGNLRPKNQGRRDDERHFRVLDYGAKQGGRSHPRQSDARHFDDARGSRHLDDGFARGGTEASAASARRCFDDRRPW